MRQTACLVVNPITVDNYAWLFNCTKVVRAKSTFRHLKQGIQDFHGKYVLVPADKAANNVVVVWRLHYINTLKQELRETKA